MSQFEKILAGCAGPMNKDASNMRYFFAILAVCIIGSSGSIAQEITDTPEATSKIEVVLPGILEDGSPEVHTGDTWWGLRETEVKSYELVQTTVTIKTVSHWRTRKDVLELVPDVEGKYLFLIKGSPLLKEGHVETDYNFYFTKLLPGQEMGTRNFKRGHYTNRYTIFALGNVQKKRMAEEYSINISGAANSDDSFQTIVRLQQVDTEFGDVPRIIWVGDIDRDLKPDIFMTNSLRNEKTYTLFLSSEAREGEVVHKVAEIHTY